jgi:hypothetical protein
MSAVAEMKVKKEKKVKGEKKRERSASPEVEDAKAAKRAMKKAKKAAAAAATDEDDSPPTPTKNFSVDNLTALAKVGGGKKEELASFFAHGDVAKRTSDWLTEHEVTVHDAGCATKICLDFTNAPFDAPLVKLLQQQGFPSPSAVQGAAWPMAAEGRDILAIAKTGSGKTLGFLLPALTTCAAAMKTSKVGLTIAPCYFFWLFSETSLPPLVAHEAAKLLVLRLSMPPSSVVQHATPPRRLPGDPTLEPIYARMKKKLASI